MWQALSRDEFLRLLILSSNTLDQRVLTGQIAFAFGCPLPAHAGEYLPIDGVAVMTTSMLAATGVKLEDAAGAVRQRSEDWLKLVTRAEREPIFGSGGEQVGPELFFVVATVFDGSFLSRRVAVGTMDEIMAAFRDKSLHAAGFVSIHRVLRQLRANARLAKPKVALPDRFTIAPDEPGYENWRREIAAYQERAEARFKAKAKGRRPARAPAGKRPLLKV
jgi:hypothetical protein